MHRKASSRRGVRIVVAVLAAALVGFSSWALFEYAQGGDPVAWLSSQPALQTTRDSQDGANGNTNDSADVSNGGDASDQTSESTGDDQPGAGSESSAQASSDSALQDGSPSSDASDASGSANGSASGASGSGSDEAVGSLRGSGGVGSRAGASGSGPSADSGSGQGSVTTGQGTSQAQPAAPAGQPQPAQPQTISVSVTIDGTPAGGSLHGGTVELASGSNVYDALVAADGNINARDTIYGTYVAAIDGLAEKQHGGMSGWVYAVNGVEPNTACSNYTLSAGDTVVWTYVNVEG